MLAFRVVKHVNVLASPRCIKVVSGRSAFFSILKRAQLPFHKRTQGPLSPLEGRVQHIIWELGKAWLPPRRTVLAPMLVHLPTLTE